MDEKALVAAVADIENVHEYFNKGEFPTSVVMTKYDHDSLSTSEQSILHYYYKKVEVSEDVVIYHPGIFFDEGISDTFRKYDYFKCPFGNIYEFAGYWRSKEKSPEIIVKSHIINEKNLYPEVKYTLADIKEFFYKRPEILKKGDENYYIKKVTERSKKQKEKNLIKGR